jgi:PAS domain S-box-containing protein
MRSHFLTAGIPYLIGAIAVATATLVHLVLRSMWAIEPGVAPFVAAVATTLWLAGSGPALLAAAMALAWTLRMPYPIDGEGIVAGLFWVLAGSAVAAHVVQRRGRHNFDAVLIEASRDPVVVLDSKGRIASMNAAARTLTAAGNGLEPAALARRLLALGTPVRERELILEHPQQSPRSYLVSCTTERPHARGRQIFVLRALRRESADAPGEPLAAQRLQALADACEAQMFHVDACFQVTWFNRRFRQRHDLEEEAGPLVWDLFDAQTRAALWSPLQRGMAGQYDSLEWRAQDERGNSIWTLSLVSPEFDEACKVRGCFVLCVDAGLLHGEQLDRHRNEDIRRNVLECLPDLVWMISADGTANWFNPRWPEYTGTPAIDWTEAMPATDREQALAAWQLARTTGTELRIEVRMRRHDGELRWHLVRMRPLREPGGDPTIHGWCGSCTDIDDRKRAEVELGKSRQRVAGFLGHLSHELRNPLAALSASIQVLRHPRAAPNMTAHALDVLERQSVSLAHLVDELLQATRLMDGRIELQRRNMELGRIAGEVCRDLAPRASALGITLNCDIAETALPLFADPQRIRQALDHLLVHALGSCSAGDTVSVHEIDGEHGEAGLRIADTGRGMSRDELGIVFEPGNAESGNGLGLGLNLARRIAQLHGGTIVAISDGPGMGCAFDLYLPVREAGTRESGIEVPSTFRPRRIVNAS